MADQVYTVDTSVWEAKLAQLSAETGKTMRAAINDEWPLLVRRIIDFTPPKTLAQGRAAVALDIRKTMRPFDPKSDRTAGLREIVEKRDIEGFNILARRSKSGVMAGKTAVDFSTALHTSKRNARGRVGQDTRRVVLGSDSALLKQYVKSIQDRVGWAKAGWLRAYHLVGGVGANFVERHSPGSGDVVDGRMDENPSVTAINRTPWAVRRDEAYRIINAAFQSRAVAIFEKTKVALRLAAKGAGFDTR